MVELGELPDYMAPQAFVQLRALPLLPNGKVDRQALPAPDTARPELEDAFVSPRTAAESLIAEVWKDVLSVDWVGIDDNFLELGGHSLLAMKAIGRLEKRMGVRMNLMGMFTQTLRQLASACHRRHGNFPTQAAPKGGVRKILRAARRAFQRKFSQDRSANS